VDVAFQPPALGVLRGNQPLAGGPEVLEQADVAKDQRGLSGQSQDEPLLRRDHWIAGSLHQRDRSEQLVLMHDGVDAIPAGKDGEARGRRPAPP